MTTVLRLGIHAPYTWDVSTHMACVLGDLATVSSLPVSYLSYQAHDQGVHSQWDSRVLSSKRQDFGDWARDCSHLVWFAVHKNKLEIARQLGCHNTLVLLWNRLNPSDLEAIKQFDRVVCPTAASYALCYDRSLHRNLSEIPWDSGLPLESQMRPVDSDRQKVLAVVEGQTARKHGATLFSTIQMLLDAQPQVDLTLCHNRNWSRPALQQLNDLVRHRRDRITVRRKPPRTWRHLAYGQHHWTWLPNLYSNVGFYALESLACNCPVLTYDLPPVTEFVRQAHNGHLIHCQQDSNWLGVPQGKLNARALLSGLEEALEDSKYQEALRQTSWPERENRRSHFKHAWRKLWDLDS